MSTSSSFTLLVTLAVPALALAACSSSVSSGGGSTSTTTSSASAGGGSSSSTGGEGGRASSTASVTVGATTSSSGTGGTGGSGGSASTTGSSSATSSTASTSSASSGGGGLCSGGNVGLPAAVCTPTDPSCDTQSAECLPLHHYAGASTFGLRMADLSLTAPPALTKGLVKGVLASGVTLNQAACNLNGGGTFSWLLQFDTIAGTVKTGGAKPQSDPTVGYSFVDQNYPAIGGMIHVTPVTLTAPLDAACSTNSSAGNLNLPIYLDLAATQLLELPLRQARFVNVTVSGNHDCIGKYNAAGLDPAGGCIADDQHPTFFPDAQVVGMINLEEADTVPINALGQSLCVVLSGDAATYGNGASPMAQCKRVNGKILFQGDWCTATNQAASAQCKDALYFAGGFAASGVIIN